MTWLKKDIRIGDIINLMVLVIAGIYMVAELQGTVQNLTSTLNSLDSTVIKFGVELRDVRDRVIRLEAIRDERSRADRER